MMGWNDSQVYWKTRSGRSKTSSRKRQLQPTELATMALILKLPVGGFMEEVARATGIPEPVPYYTARREIERRKAQQSPARGGRPLDITNLKARIVRDGKGRFALHGKRHKPRIPFGRSTNRWAVPQKLKPYDPDYYGG